MANPFYAEFPESSDTGPRQYGTKAPDTTGASKKGQRGGWVPKTALGRSPGAGRCSTGKQYGSGGYRVSSNKSDMS
jgi:hypothetical protein